RGAHKPVMVSLVIQLSLAADVGTVRVRYRTLADWLRAGGDSEGSSVDGRERLIEDLEQAAEVWASPFVVSELAALYLDRQNQDGSLNLFNRRLKRGADLQELLARSQ